MTALSDLSIVELSAGVAGAFCAKMFADFGADVLKVEPLGGDPIRSFGPFPDDILDFDKSGLFIYLNTNKRGIVLDIDSADDRAIAFDLCAKADVVIEGFPPGYADEIGLGHERLELCNPRVVSVSITPFGQSGPWRNWQTTDLVQYAASGLGYVNGSPRRKPLKEPGPESEFQAGASAFIGAMTALAYRDMTGQGQRVDVSVLDSAASTFAPQFLGAMHSCQPVTRGATPLLPCKDGWVSLNVRHDATWEYMWLFFGEPELARDTRFATAADRRRLNAEIEEILLPHLARHTMQELFYGLAPLRILIGMTLGAENLSDDEHLRARGFFVDTPDGTTIPGAPFVMSETAWNLRTSAPSLGQRDCESFISEPKRMAGNA